MGEAADEPRPVHAPRLDQHISGLAPMGARIHAQGAADGAGNAAQEGEAINASLRRRPRRLHVGHGGSCTQAVVGQDLDLAKGLAAEANDNAGHAAIAHDQVGAQPDHRHRDLARQMREKIGEVRFVRWREKRLRRPAHAKPGIGRERLVGRQPPA